MHIDCNEIVVFVDFISNHDKNFVKLIFVDTKKLYFDLIFKKFNFFISFRNTLLHNQH